MREIALKTEKLSKRYKDFSALCDIDMTVFSGDIYGFIGRNGAGKTTAMKIFTGLTEKSDGEFEIFGKRGADAEREKKRIGCLIENPAFFKGLSAWQNLKYYALQKGITDMSQIDTALSLVGLSDSKNKKFKNFSLGMKQRLGIAFALLDNPDLIILDEPINGLDPIGISELRETFHRLNTEHGITFIISSHILSELYMTANRFLIIDRGRVLKELSKEELDLACMRCIAIKTGNAKKAVTVIEDTLAVTDYKVINDNEIRIYQEGIKPEELNRLLIEHDVSVSSVYETGVSLEDYFISLVGEEKTDV